MKKSEELEVVRAITLLFFFLVVALRSSAESPDCAPVRLDKGQGLLSGVPPLQQGSVKHCANITAALLMTAYLRHLHPEMNDVIIAPEKIWTQILASDPKDQEKFLSATLGRTCSSVDLLKTTGGCNRFELRKVLRSVAETKLHRHADREEVDFAFDDMIKIFENLVPHKGTPLSREEIETIRKSILAVGVPDEAIPGNKEIAESGNGFHLLDLVFENACHENGFWISASKFKSPEASERPNCKMFDFIHHPGDDSQVLQTPDNFRSELHRLLSLPISEALPVGIAYCSGVLLHPKSEFIKSRSFSLDVDHLNGAKAKENLAPSCKFHASVVVGRQRRDDGKCYFLIQNSWGSACNMYSSSNQCENGKVWVEENVLSRNILRLIHLTN